MDNKKYVIAWHDSSGVIATYYGVDVSYTIPLSWYVAFSKATVFTRSEAEKMHSEIVDWYKTNAPNVYIGAKIHEYIPATVGAELKSERDELLEELRGLINSHIPVTFGMTTNGIKKAIDFIEKNTK